MEDAYKAGKVRAIGVSNFYPDILIDLVQFNKVVPAVNQVETHPLQQQKAAHDIMKKYGVQHESWGLFAEGRKDMFTNPAIKGIGDKYGKSVAQVILRFLIQSDVVDEEDMKTIASLDTQESAFFSHYDPATVEFLTGLGK